MHSRALSVLLLLSFCCARVIVGTPLDDYVNAPDPTYKWTLNSSFSSLLGYKGYNIDLISQTWMTAKETNAPVWRHWLTICVPDTLDLRYAHNVFMWIDGGSTHDTAPKDVSLVARGVCVASRTITAALLQIPDQPLIFFNDGVKRSEDGLIAYGWRHFLNHTDQPIWLPRLPMTKAAVRAMDTIQAFVATLPGVPQIKNFVVSGASKRGWTTWTTGAVDKRVVAIIPVVMPILNIVPNMNHHYQAYGGWSFALDDYLKQHVMHYLNDPSFLKLAAIVDPWTYRDRLTMPKLVILATGDEFFLPDSAQFFMAGLPGEKHLAAIPDAEHTLVTAYLDVFETITTFYQLVISNHKRPVYSYSLQRGNTSASITVKVDPKDQPSYVRTWYASTLSAKLRDFRLVKCAKLSDCLQPVIWWYEDLSESIPGSGVYVATKNAPPYGWTGFLVELTYEYKDIFFPGKRLLRVTTDVNIVPDAMPFPPCGNHCQP